MLYGVKFYFDGIGIWIFLKEDIFVNFDVLSVYVNGMINLF